MKILVVCQYYKPEPFRISDICEALVQMGHSVTVVTGTPNYPEGEIYTGYENGKKQDEVLCGVAVHRCSILPRKTGAVRRFLNYYSFVFASKRYLRGMKEDFDLVFVNQLSPVMMAQSGLAWAKRHRKKCVLYCLDLWPESLKLGGIRPGSLVYRIFWRISKRIYRSSDRILITSQMFRQYMTEQFGIGGDKLFYLPQYAESQFLHLEEKAPTDAFHVMFAGNIGAAQDVGTIVEAAGLLRNEKVFFHIVGDGSALNEMQKSAENVPNITFYGRKPLEEMPEFYAMADAMLVTLNDDAFAAMTLPGKVQTYLAAGKPIVGAANGETEMVLTECQGGFCGKSGDAGALAESIRALRNSGRAAQIGQNNREYYLRRFSKENFLLELIGHFSEITAK